MTTIEFIRTIDDKAMVLLLQDLYTRGFELPFLEVVVKNINQYSYYDFAKVLANAMNIDYNRTKDERLYNYISDLAKDITNHYNCFTSQLLNADLNLEWFVYNGSNLTNTRPFCLAMTKKKYFHRCEIPSLIAGEFAEFEEIEDFGFEETETPTGFYAGTNEDNFLIYRGGYGCCHSADPVDEIAVPQKIKDALFTTKEYKDWYKTNYLQ